MTLAKSKLKFFFEAPVSLKKRNELIRFIESLFNKEGKKLSSLIYIFTTDRNLLKLNLEYLDHNFYTDILTFDLSENSSITAEIYISVERVKENALLENVSFKNELLRVMFHGALHLCGYKDQTVNQKKKIRHKEDYYLHLFHVKEKIRST